MDDGQSAKRCFPPVADANTRVLILGSLPGDASLKASQYYAHPRNAFWALLSGLIAVDLPVLPYEVRLQALLAHGVGLWDVIAEAERKGSLDAAIRNQTHNGLSQLISSLPMLQAVAFNGGTAAKFGRRQLACLAERLVLLDLPSSSPAYTLPFEKKSQAWAGLGPYLDGKI